MDSNLKKMTSIIREIESEHDSRKDMLKGMNDHIKTMLRSDCSKDAETQVGAGELFCNIATQIYE